MKQSEKNPSLQTGRGMDSAEFIRPFSTAGDPTMSYSIFITSYHMNESNLVPYNLMKRTC